MAKYKDRIKVGKSKLCPFVPDVPCKERHARRKIFNDKRRDVVEDFCNENGLRFKWLNGGYHWQVISEKKIIEWWPSSAKVVVNKKWKSGIHCHDYEQFIEILKKEIGLKG